MCKHEFTIKSFNAPNTCWIQELYSQHPDIMGTTPLPHDEDGICLFHSGDWEWKLDKGLEDAQRLLLELMRSNEHIKQVDFRDFFLTAADTEQGVVWENLSASKPVNLCGATFRGRFALRNCRFEDDFYLDRATFGSIFEMEHCEFGGHFTAVHHTVFQDNLYLADTVFSDLFDVQDAMFMGQVNIASVVFNGYTVWDRAVFNDDMGVLCYFNFTTKDYTSFKGTVFKDAVQFEQCSFEGDTHFVGTSFLGPLHFTQPSIKANIFFKGNSEEAPIFGNEVTMVLSSQDFGGTGQIIFEHANLVQLDRATKQQLSKLKAQRLVVLGPGTLVFRISFQETYPFSEMNEVFLHDLLNTIRQYFHCKLVKHFEFVFTKEQDDLVVTFFSDDFAKQSDFKKEQVRSVLALNQQQQVTKQIGDALEQYLASKFQFQLQGLLQDRLSAENLPKLLGGAKLNILLKADSIHSITANHLKIGTVHDSNFYISKLATMHNQPEFCLSDKQFGALKKQLTSQLDNDSLKRIEVAVAAINQQLLEQDSAKNLLVECGISNANNISASVLMMFLTQWLMS